MRLVFLALAVVLLTVFMILNFIPGASNPLSTVAASTEEATSLLSETVSPATNTDPSAGATTAPQLRPVQPTESTMTPEASTAEASTVPNLQPSTQSTPTADSGTQSSARPSTQPIAGNDARFLASPYYNASHHDRYEAYAQAWPALAPERVVIEVEMKLDREFYSDITVIDQPAALDVLCNKCYALPEDYVPELVDMPTGYFVEDGKSYQLRPDALAAFIAMSDAARAEGYSLKVISAYRSRNYQNNLYQRYSDSYGREAADTYSARPRHSEHETGLAVDINSVDTTFENTREFQWLQLNAHKFGFILRYPSKSQEITGYIYEPWHYRYLGPELATKVRESKLTYDEFYLRRGEF